MFKASAVRLSALSKRTKRVRVQLLKDFPMFNLYMGQVTNVKPSFMRNYLHNFNGARYIMAESDIDLELLSRSQAREALMKDIPTKSDAKTISEDAQRDVAQEVADAVKVKPAKRTEPEQEKPKGVLDKKITIKDVKIPGLDL